MPKSQRRPTGRQLRGVAGYRWFAGRRRTETKWRVWRSVELQTSTLSGAAWP